MQISKKATVDIGEHKHDSFLAHFYLFFVPVDFFS